MRGDQGGNRGRSGPRQRSAAGHEAWLLSGAWNLGLESACNPFGPLSLPILPYPGVRICPVGLNQVG